MKNPKWREAYPQGHKVKYGGKFLTTWSGYSLSLEQTNGGTISAQRNHGYEDDEVPMSYTANQDCYFNGWSANEGSFIGNNYKFGTNDATAKASFVNAGAKSTIHETYNKAATISGAYELTGGTGVGGNYISEVKSNTATNIPDRLGLTVSGLPIMCVHYKFQNSAVNPSNCMFGFQSQASAWESVWDGSSWQLRQGGPDLWDNMPATYLDKVNTNYFPLMDFEHAKSQYVNTNKATLSGGRVLVNNNNWLNESNDLKYFINFSAGDSNNQNFDRSCFVSAYYNNEFICSSWQGLYNVVFSLYKAGGGLYSANGRTHSAGYILGGTTRTLYYNDYEAAPGTAKYDLGWFTKGNEQNAYRWLMEQN